MTSSSLVCEHCDQVISTKSQRPSTKMKKAMNIKVGERIFRGEQSYLVANKTTRGSEVAFALNRCAVPSLFVDKHYRLKVVNA